MTQVSMLGGTADAGASRAMYDSCHGVGGTSSKYNLPEYQCPIG